MPISLPSDAPAQAITPKSLAGLFEQVRKERDFLSTGTLFRKPLEDLLGQIADLEPIFQALLDIERTAHTCETYVENMDPESGRPSGDMAHWDIEEIRQANMTALGNLANLLAKACPAPLVSRYAPWTPPGTEETFKGLLDGVVGPGTGFRVLVTHEEQIECANCNDDDTIGEKTVAYESAEAATRDARVRIASGDRAWAGEVWIARPLNSRETQVWRSLESKWREEFKKHSIAAAAHNDRVKEAQALKSLIKRKEQERATAYDAMATSTVESLNGTIKTLYEQREAVVKEITTLNDGIPADLRGKLGVRAFSSI